MTQRKVDIEPKSDINTQVFLPSHKRYEQQLNRVDSLGLESIYYEVENWLKKRPLMLENDKRKDIFKLILAEIDEYVADLFLTFTSKDDSSGKGDYLKLRLSNIRSISKNYPNSTEEEWQFKQWLRLFSEAFDEIFFIMGHAIGNQIQFDYTSIYGQINGQGNRSNVEDELRLLASGILDIDPTVALQRYLVVCSSKITHLRMFIDPRYVIKNIIDKNSRNHPEEVYQNNQVIFDQTLGREIMIELLPEEQDEAFANRILGMRLIRRAVEIAQPVDQAKVQSEIVKQTLWMILNHRDKTKIYSLAEYLVRTLGQDGKVFSFNRLMGLEADSHRVVPGLKTERQILPHYNGKVDIL